MKILTYCALPFGLAHGGVTNIARRTTAVLERLGFEVEPLRWWDETQTGDVLFCFCRTDNTLVDYAKAKGMTVVVEQVLTGLVSRPLWKRRIQKAIKRGIESFAPAMLREPYGWRAFHAADLHCVPSPHDGNVMTHMFEVPPEKICLLPYGVDDEFLDAKETPRGDHLICTATVTERKRVAEVAAAAARAGTPLWVVGKTYGEADAYGKRFLDVVAHSNGTVRHIPHVEGRAALAAMLREARGFVLLSTMETVSQSAIEAAACRCPLLLSDLDWARVAFGKNASYCRVDASCDEMAAQLKRFYNDCTSFKQEFAAKSWWDARRHIGEAIRRITPSGEPPCREAAPSHSMSRRSPDPAELGHPPGRQ